MYEVEVKVPAELTRVRDRLSRLDAVSLGMVTQNDTYYDAPHRDFAATDEALRLRREVTDDQSDWTLTYKGPLVDDASKTRQEIETGLADGAAADQILRQVGFEPAATVEKDRDRYRVDGYLVVLDRVAGVGEFVEVETTAEAIAPAREGAITVIEELGLDPDDRIQTSYLAMVMAAE